MNKDSKTKGGIIGVTQDINAVEKWAMTAHLRAAVHANFKDICGVSQFNQEKELARKTISDSEIHVVQVINAFKDHHANPFFFNSIGSKSPLKNIISGSIVKDEHRHEVLHAKSIGKESSDQFIKERFIEKTVPFWNPVKKLKLHTFTSQNKTIKLPSINKEKAATMKNHQNLFSRIITVSSARKIDLKSVMSYELSSVPLSLFHATGEMRKTNKSQLLQELQIEEEPITQLDRGKETSASIIDFMALVQSMNKHDIVTFGELADRFKSSIFSNFRESDYIAVVPDRYNVELSIKGDERSRRQTTLTNQTSISHDSQKLPSKFQVFLTNSNNKINLISYIFSKWKVEIPRSLFRNQRIFLFNLDGSCDELGEGSSFTHEWSCDHEEADSGMFVISHYLYKHFRLDRMIISSPDTDVAVISCFHFVVNFDSLGELWFKTGVAEKKRYIAIHETAKSLGASICRLLPAFHSITGCDTVSSFSGIGKKSSFSCLKNNIDKFIDIFEFGDSPELSLDCDAVEASIKFVCLLYDSKFDGADINSLRHRLFTRKNTCGEKLPPTLDALTFHLRRANYQCYIWKSACSAILNLPSPVGNGWIMENDILKQELMIHDAVPTSVVELVRCQCKKACKTNSCSCKKENLICTEACLCSDFMDCENVYIPDSDSSADDEEDI